MIAASEQIIKKIEKKMNDMKSVITCDMEGRIETFSKGAEQFFGYHAEEVVGKERFLFFSPGNRSAKCARMAGAGE